MKDGDTPKGKEWLVLIGLILVFTAFLFIVGPVLVK